MYRGMTEITYTNYFNDIVYWFYEDEGDVKRLGNTLGLDIDKEYFVAIAFLYPSTPHTTYEEKEKLKNELPKIQVLPKKNSEIRENQFVITDSGVITFLIGETRKELMEILPEYKEKAAEVISEIHSDKKIRIGVGTIESGIVGVRNTYENAINAVKAGEIFKKERVVLDYIGMEIYSSINSMITSYGDRITKAVLKQINKDDQRILAKYYKCKDKIDETATALGISSEEVENALARVKNNTGLDVNDTEDNFKLHLVMIAKKVLSNNEKIKEAEKNNEV
jgi:sugar diacid utilization regulator